MAQQSFYSGTPGAPGALSGYNSLQTPSNAVTVLYTEPAEVASTTYDYVMTVMGSNPANGDLYRADFAFNYQRIGAAAPTVAGPAPVPLNVRTTGAGNTYPGVTFSVVGNNVVVSVQGLVGVPINWNMQLNRAQVP